jgi:hypothetical protein
MTPEAFLKYFRAQVKKYRHQYSLNEGKAFGLWYASDSLGLEDDEAYEAVSFDGANDKDIDFFFVDQEAQRVLIGQLKFNGLGKYKGKNRNFSVLFTPLTGSKILNPWRGPGGRTSVVRDSLPIL